MDNEPLSWEYLFDTVESWVEGYEKLKGKDLYPEGSQWDDIRESWRISHERQLNAVLGLKDVLPRLYAHPELGEFIPYMVMKTLHWSPAAHYLLTLDSWGGRDEYRITLFHKKKQLAQTVVPLNDVTDTLLEYMQKARTDSIP